MTNDHRRGLARLPVLVCLEIALAIAIVWGIYAWRTKDLLTSDGSLQAPYFELMDLQGRVTTLEDFSGKPTLLYFFAPWCKVCNASAHQLRWFDNWLGDEVNLVMIALDFADPMEVKAFRDKHKLQAEILLGSRRTLIDFQIPGYPTYYLLDGSGRIQKKDFGYTTVVGLVWRVVSGS
ncbi:MAG: peroxiredoxin family protein [Gammaproteobacteria bacterium]